MFIDVSAYNENNDHKESSSNTNFNIITLFDGTIIDALLLKRLKTKTYLYFINYGYIRNKD